MSDNLSRSQADTLMQQLERQVPVNRSADPRMARVQPYAFREESAVAMSASGVPFERLHQTMLAEVRTLVFDITRQKPAVSLESLAPLPYREWRAVWEEPCLLYQLRLEPLGVTAVLAVEGALVCGLVDLIFGGDGSPLKRMRRKVFSHSEAQVAGKFVDRLLQTFNTYWADIMPVSFHRSRVESQPQFANFLPDGDALCGFRFALTLGRASAGVSILFPAAALTELQERFAPAAATDSKTRNEGWEHQIRRRLEGAEVEMVAELATIQLNIAELISLQRGDIIPIPVPGALTVRVGERPVFACTFGVSQGRHAIQVEQRLAGLSEWERENNSAPASSAGASQTGEAQ